MVDHRIAAVKIPTDLYDEIERQVLAENRSFDELTAEAYTLLLRMRANAGCTARTADGNRRVDPDAASDRLPIFAGQGVAP